MRRIIGMTVFALALASAQAAFAATYSGTASNGTTVTLQTDEAGVPNRVEFGDYKLKCLQHKLRVRNPITGFASPFDSVSSHAVRDHGEAKHPVHVRGLGRLHVVAGWTLTMHLNDRGGWGGSFYTQGVYRSHGDPFDRCRIGFDFRLSPN